LRFILQFEKQKLNQHELAVSAHFIRLALDQCKLALD